MFKFLILLVFLENSYAENNISVVLITPDSQVHWATIRGERKSPWLANIALVWKWQQAHLHSVTEFSTELRSLIKLLKLINFVNLIIMILKPWYYK